MATWRGWTYSEVAPNGTDESFSTDNSRAVRCLQFMGSPSREERVQIARDFLGYAKLETAPADVVGPGVVKKYISRVTPHPYQGDSGYLYASRISRTQMVGEPGTEPGARGDVVGRYPCYRIWLEYSTLPYDVGDDHSVRALTNTSPLYIDAGTQYPDEGYWLQTSWTLTRSITRTMEPSGRITALKQGMMRFAGTAGVDGYPEGIPTFEPLPFPEAMSYVTYTWWGVPAAAFPQATVQSSLGKLNNNSFDGWTSGTLLLLSLAMKPRRDPFGQRTLDVSYRMLWAPKVGEGGVALGHNAIPWVSKTSGVRYFYVSTDGSNDTTKRTFKSTDFMAFFRPEQA